MLHFSNYFMMNYIWLYCFYFFCLILNLVWFYFILFIFFCKSFCNIVKNCFILLLNSWGRLSGGAGPLWASGSGRGAVTHFAWLVFFASPVFFDLFYCEDKSGIIEPRTGPVLQVSCRWCSAGCWFESLVWHQRHLVTRRRSCYISPDLVKPEMWWGKALCVWSFYDAEDAEVHSADETETEQQFTSWFCSTKSSSLVSVLTQHSDCRGGVSPRVVWCCVVLCSVCVVSPCSHPPPHLILPATQAGWYKVLLVPVGRAAVVHRCDWATHCTGSFGALCWLVSFSL